jgi:pimeloyl-ACP methyl ester carboxylesterase
VEVASGASARLTAGGGGRLAVVCLNGGTGRLRPGDWSATNEWLIGRLSGDFPAVTFVEARYRVKSWRCLDDCIVDARDVLELAVAEGLDRFLLLGFSMGGAVSIAVGDHPAVRTVIGLAPWIPSRLDVSTMRGRRFVAIHGSLDRPLPGIPGVSPAQSKEGVERLRAAGAEASRGAGRAGCHDLASLARTDDARQSPGSAACQITPSICSLISSNRGSPLSLMALREARAQASSFALCVTGCFALRAAPVGGSFA